MHIANSFPHIAQMFAGVLKACRRLIEPFPAITNTVERRQARLLAFLMLVAIPIGIIIFFTRLSYAKNVWAAYCIGSLTFAQILIGYALSRTRRFRLGAFIASLGMAIACYFGVIVNKESTAFLYLSFSAIVAVLFLKPPYGVGVSVFHIFVVLAIFPLVLPEAFIAASFHDRIFFVALSILISTTGTIRQRDLVQIDRQGQELLQAEQNRLALIIERQRIEILRQFLHDASHDIKTPLSSIRLSLELLRRSPPDQHGRYIEMLADETSRLEVLLLDMLLLSQLDAGIDMEHEPVNLDEVLAAVMTEMETLTDQNQQKLVFAKHTAGLCIVGDKTYLQRALKNIVQNALQNSPPRGEISLTSYIKGQEISIAVKDDGIGIPSEELPHIFERFYRIDKARNQTTGSAGLGLAISQKIVEAHGGQIVVESVPQQGSLFRVILPAWQPTNNEAAR